MAKRFIIAAITLALSFPGLAELVVTVRPVKLVGQKAIVPLGLKNDFNTKIESARAVVFLLDEHGKMAAQGTRWIIGGGNNTNGLAAHSTNVFNFVLQADRPFTMTNLKASISVTRVVLEGNRAANVKTEVRIQEAK
jgi:hypothetical protein